MGKKRILIIDDEKDFCRIIKMNLEGTGEYEVRTESSATQAFTTAREFKPDLILLDFLMPGMDGGEVAHQIRSNDGFKHIPIVLLTAIVAKNEETTLEAIINGQPFPSLAKPVNLEKLIDCIKQNIGK